MTKPKLISLWINPNRPSLINYCEIDIAGLSMKIHLNQEQVDKITDLIYEHLGSTLMQAFAEKINPELASDEKGFSANPFILSK